MPDIVLTRDSCYADWLRAYKVFIDGEQRGVIRDDETARFPVSQGQHSVMLRVDFCRSPELAVAVGADDFHVSCGSNVKPLLALIYLFMPGSWIWVKVADAPQTRTLFPG
jgi:hypothetical protein